MHDVRVLLDEEAIDRSFTWTLAGTNQVLDEFAYKVIVNGIGLADNRSGNIRYYPDLHVRTSQYLSRTPIVGVTCPRPKEHDQGRPRPDMGSGWPARL